MKSIRKLLFTFDYELFLGKRSGTVNNCCLDPVNQLLKIFERHEIKNCIFFIDTTYLVKLSENVNNLAKNDYNLIVEQLKYIVRSGHYIFPHIHPHWLDAKYLKDLNQWDLSYSRKYRFDNIEEKEQEFLFAKSVELLSEISSSVKSNYKIDSYRAGGWCIQPFSSFKKFFDKFDISNDFSVLSSKSNNSKNQWYDFTECPSEKIYLFEDDIVKINEKGNYKEFTISVIPVSSFNSFINKIYLKFAWKMGFKCFGDGIGSSDAGSINNVKDNNTEMVSLELLTPVRLFLYKTFLRKNEYMHFISHPKMLTTANLKCFENFLSFAKLNYQFETDYKNMK